MKKTVLITGGSRGIGAETVRLFAEKGYNVAFIYNKSVDKATELSAKTGAYGIQADVGDSKTLLNAIEKINNKFGGVDILINNAGIARQKLFTDITEAEWDKMFDVNVKSIFTTTKALLPYMINRKWGRIINISSIWGVTGASCEVHYSASKAAIIGFTKALAKEVGPSGITVNCIAPGVIETEMNKNLDEETIEGLKEETPLCRIGTPLDVAESALFLASDKASFITGQILGVNGGIVI